MSGEKGVRGYTLSRVLWDSMTPKDMRSDEELIERLDYVAKQSSSFAIQ